MPLDVYDIPSDSDVPGGASPGGYRPYISVLFECCGVYARVYRRPEQRYYHGRCPKCLRTVHVRVGPEGTSARFFRAT
jgi:hypothetical protein